MPPYSARSVLTSLFGRAAAMSTKASSMDDIVDMAHMLILDAVGARLLTS